MMRGIIFFRPEQFLIAAIGWLQCRGALQYLIGQLGLNGLLLVLKKYLDIHHGRRMFHH